MSRSQSTSDPSSAGHSSARERYQILDWDSDFFGLRVARISEPRLTARELSVLLLELKRSHTRLVYWPSDRKVDGDVIKKLHGHLADVKTTFAIDFGTLDLDQCVATDIVEIYTQSMPMAGIVDLAIQSGEQSRYATDPNIPREKFVDLYTIWIKRSLKKEIAAEVMIIPGDDRVRGMITLGEKNGRGDIGLIAVDRDSRGKRYGEKLVRAAQRWFVDNGYELGQVVTQGKNIPACNLYKKCGYHVETVEFFYHFWL